MDEDTTERPGRARRYGKVMGLGLLIAGIAIGSATTSVVWATHDFPDVPNSSPHHADISWAVDNDITQGYNDGTFKPTQAVSRQTMATFLRRLNGATHLVSEAVAGSSSVAAVSTDCAPGERAIAGGGSNSGSDIFITDSYPLGATWTVRWESENDASLLGETFTGWALCAPGL